MKSRLSTASLSALLAGVVCIAAAASACAREAPDGAAPRASEVGHATRAWIELQESNRDAASAPPMLGEAASLAYQRYLDSFRTKIPASFGSSITSGNGGWIGGGGAGGGSGGPPSGQ